MKNKYWFFYSLIILLIPCLILAEEDSVSFVSYYPSAYGVYRQLKLHPVADMTAADCYEANEGAMFYDKNTNETKVCRKESINNYTWQAFQTKTGGAFVNFVVYDVPNNYQWKVPDGVFRIKMEVWGAGGGGNPGPIGGGGGGGGGYGMGIIDVNPGDKYDITVGEGGLGGICGSAGSRDGSAGKDSAISFSSTDLIVAAGGDQGWKGTISTGGPYGLGGVVTGIEAQIATRGQNGQRAFVPTTTLYHPGKGGNAGGPGGGFGGYQGWANSSPLGNTSNPDGNPIQSGDNGEAPGGGGGGTSNCAENNTIGGDGASGRVIIWY